MIARHLFRLLSVAALATCVCAAAVYAQGPPAPGARQQQPPPPQPQPSSAEAETFSSLDGRFTIALPRQVNGYSGIRLDTPKGAAEVGDTYTWRAHENEYDVGFIDKSKTDKPEVDSEAVMLSLNEVMVERSAARQGKVTARRRLTVSGLPADEVRIEFSEMYVVSRVVAAGDRVYHVKAFIRKNPRALEAADKVVGSFRVLTAAEVAEATRRNVAEAAPDPLPQEPVAAKLKSDAEDEGLRGKVRTVFAESEDLSGTWSVQGRKPSSKEDYNERGNLTRREFYDYKGNLSEITVYGYLDGERVSRARSIKREYDPPPVPMGETAPGAGRQKFDPRYTNKFRYKYDDAGRLLEKAWHPNSDRPPLRYVYKYDGRRKEKLVYASDGSLNQKYVLTMDEKGHEVEETSYDVRDDAVRGRYSYSYVFDERGNWTKRVTSKWGVKDGREGYHPAYVTYRTISYYSN